MEYTATIILCWNKATNEGQKEMLEAFLCLWSHGRIPTCITAEDLKDWLITDGQNSLRDRFQKEICEENNFLIHLAWEVNMKFKLHDICRAITNIPEATLLHEHDLIALLDLVVQPLNLCQPKKFHQLWTAVKARLGVLSLAGPVLKSRQAVESSYDLTAHGATNGCGGGFMFKQWKEKYLILTTEGSLMVCRDAESPADQMVALQGGCEAIVEGREILDLPRLPPGGRRDCCLALILPQDKFLLLLADNPSDCSQWVNMLRKVKESFSSPLPNPCKRHQSLTPCITDRDPLSDPVREKGLSTRRLSERAPPSPGIGDTSQSRTRGSKSPRPPKSPGVPSRQRSAGCLRHGNSSDARAVRAVYLLMGGAAASSALGYLGSCPPSTHDPRPPEHMAAAADFPDMGAGGAYHACNQAMDSPHFHSFDFEADSDFDAFDCGGFAF